MPDVTAQLSNPQVIEIWVNGPDGANRMFVCSGFLASPWGGWQAGNAQMRETFTFHVGPPLAVREFIRACCAVGPIGISANNNPAAQGGALIRSSDADWDDEDGRVQVTVEVEADGPWMLSGFHYNVTILAEQAEQQPQ